MANAKEEHWYREYMFRFIRRKLFILNLFAAYLHILLQVDEPNFHIIYIFTIV